MTTIFKKLGKFDATSYKPPYYPFDTEFKDHVTTYNGVKYSGTVRISSEVREGLGVSVFIDGSMYEGWHKNDKMNGLGRMIKPNGEVLEGMWMAN